MSPQMEDTTILYDEIIYDTINNNINNLINHFNNNMFVDNTIQDPIQDPYLLYNTNYINPYFNPLIIPTYINEEEIIPNIDYTTINYIYDIHLTNIQYNNIIEFLNAVN
jgi:hypothetical protein